MPMNEKRQQQVIDYLYGEMDAQQRTAFERDLANDPALQAVLDGEQQLDAALPPGVQPLIDEERLQGNRWQLRQRLLKESRQRTVFTGWLQALRERPLTLALQGGAMAMTFMLGLLVATPSTTPGADFPVGPSLQQAASPLALVSDDDFEIYQLQVNSFNAATGEIDLSFSLASETRLTGNVADQGINRLMAVALQDDIDSAARLDTIHALRAVSAGNDVYEALIQVLVSDQNPGVRYQAVQALVNLTHEERVRDALRHALQQDVNQGVRVEAFNALAEYRDPQTLQVFREQMENDSNEYIRTQARSIVESVDSGDQDTFIY